MYILVIMVSPTPIQYGSWLKSPLRSELGSIELAGALKNVKGIDPKSMRTLEKYALIFIQSGRGNYIDENGIKHRFKAGDALLIFPEIAHSYGPNEGSDWEQIYIVFTGPQFEFLRQSDLLMPTSPVWHLEPIEYWRRRLEAIVTASTLQTNTESLGAIGRFISLLIDMSASHSEAKRTSQEAWLHESKRLLSEPSKKGWLHPKETARRVGLSYENFRKLFTKNTGESPGQFQKRRRIEHACSLIYHSSHSFKELAEEHGFCDVFHFSKVFTQVMGESPSVYRKRLNGR
ncbi:AraC family transcriptional regulator [Puniceicoccaceae bacterium K14]|nr:AraC family transcriptional regulator [Puniceicoccaceae bacterium K14]